MANEQGVAPHDEVAAPHAPLLSGLDIASMLQSKGPVVKCVVLRAPKHKPIDEDGKVAAVAAVATAAEVTNNPPGDEKELLEHLVDEIEIDTTPQKNEVQKVLGGPPTFIGQFEREGIVLMALRGFVEEKSETGNNNNNREFDYDFAGISVKELRAQCKEWDVNTENMLEKRDLESALKKKELELPSINPHSLQPPLNNVYVRGPILILKVAQVNEPLDTEEGNAVENDEKDDGGICKDDSTEEDKINENNTVNEKGDEDIGIQNEGETLPTSTTPLEISSNAEFFFSYTKAEYLIFAARTDIKKTLPSQNRAADGGNDEEVEDGTDNDDEDGEGDEDSEDDQDDENDGDFELVDTSMEEEMTEEEEKSAMLNIVMAELLRKFRDQNERGANSREVLEIRASVAEQLEIEVTKYDETQDEADGDRKRPADPSDGEEGPKRKRVKFENSVKGADADDEEPNADEDEGDETSKQKESTNEGKLAEEEAKVGGVDSPQSQSEATGVASLPPENEGDAKSDEQAPS